MEQFLYNVKRFIPRPIFRFLQVPYHYIFAVLSAFIYKFPSRDITVIAVTGTKGKSTTVELVTAILEESGAKVASASTIKFKIGEKEKRNLYKMTMPGRFFTQRFLRSAVDAECKYAVIEMTSEGTKQFRHKFIELDALVFTNLTPEHIESHGSFLAYKEAKLKIRDALKKSKKRPRYIVANIDDENGKDFLAIDVENKLPYSLDDLDLHSEHKDSVTLIINSVTMRVPLAGLFNVYNTLAAIVLTRKLGVELNVIERALKNLPPVLGRVEQIHSPRDTGKNITAVVDYAHTLDSLEQLYKAFPDIKKIAVLGNCGGGRDRWKRPKMASVAEEYCEHVILTNEDPYDEDPRAIVYQMEQGIKDKEKLSIIMDRREAIAKGLEMTSDGGYVLISGKGTDPYIMGPKNTKIKWSDAMVVREEMEKMFANK